jgi:ABC-type multidrug transport system fused ATPase/permease subunit
VSLLLRFYEPTEGEVTLDGAPLRALPLAWARAQMAWVQQEPSLFNSSIAYNIGFPGEALPQKGGEAQKAPAPPRLPLRAAAEASGAHGFVSALPLGYDTLCGTRGTQLSGGQKQRVCIARALLRDAPVLLLDEATSALDSESEAQVQASVDALIDAKAAGGGGTVLVIAHRLSTVKRADLVVVLDKGRVVEQGTWAQLSEKKGGAFAAMLKLQGLV